MRFRWLKILIVWARRIVNLRKPELIHLDYIDTVLGNHSLLLLAWRVKNAHRLRILPVKKKLFGEEGAAITGLPPNIDNLNLEIAGCWRCIRLPLQLRHLAIDAETITFLEENIRIKPNLAQLIPDIPAPKPAVQKLTPSIPSLRPSFNYTPNLSFKNLEFHDS